jgi:hypothetical protein
MNTFLCDFTLPLPPPPSDVLSSALFYTFTILLTLAHGLQAFAAFAKVFLLGIRQSSPGLGFHGGT